VTIAGEAGEFRLSVDPRSGVPHTQAIRGRDLDYQAFPTEWTKLAPVQPRARGDPVIFLSGSRILEGRFEKLRSDSLVYVDISHDKYKPDIRAAPMEHVVLVFGGRGTVNE
jgi:hypothetical protein